MFAAVGMTSPPGQGWAEAGAAHTAAASAAAARAVERGSISVLGRNWCGAGASARRSPVVGRRGATLQQSVKRRGRLSDTTARAGPTFGESAGRSSAWLERWLWGPEVAG